VFAGLSADTLMSSPVSVLHGVCHSCLTPNNSFAFYTIIIHGWE